MTNKPKPLKPLKDIPSGSFLADPPPGPEMARQQMNRFMQQFRPIFDRAALVEEILAKVVRKLGERSTLDREMEEFAEMMGMPRR